MAKGSVTIIGLNDVLNDLDNIAETFTPTTLKSIDKSLAHIENNMKANAITMFDKGYAKGVMLNSISRNVNEDNGNVNSSVGVYDMSNKTGSADRRIPAPLLAFWYEMGIQPHSTKLRSRAGDSPYSSRKYRKAKNQEGKLHRGSPPIPFLSQAFDASSADIFNNLTIDLDKDLRAK